jgi:class 3 adenylate cyclase
VIRSALCPVLVQRQDELASLEEALLAARRGEGRFVVVAGEAGIGKSRLARELSAQARRLGCGVLWGGCSEAEISLPYLPFIEAIGNFRDAEGLDAVAERLGPSRGPLGQLFPQLSGDNAIERAADPAQGKLRLFEAIVSLLALAADERTMLLVIEDVHWADDSTLELLGHLARRLTALPVLVLVTYRSDELHRRHPFMPTLQAWRRSGAAEIVALEPLRAAGVAEMISSILATDQVDPALSELMYRRTEGNPFVLEEMLREAPEKPGELGAWRRDALDGIGIPETVRDTILLRLARLDRDHVAILEVGAVLGRTFDYATLLAVSQAGETDVHSALEVAIAQQLIEEDSEAPGRYRWRHALTQEAIYTETVTPRRQAIHARAADVLSEAESTRPVDLAHHLLGAGRFDDAVPVCLRSAEEAERAVAFHEAISLLERILPHLREPAEHARVVCRIGQDHWLNGESATGERFLSEGISDLERLDLRLEAARFRIVLGRCLWEGAKPDLARGEYRQALDVLSAEGPSAELAMAHVRLAGLDAFELDYESCLDHSRRAVEIAEQAGADFERVWALGFLALGLLDSGRHERGFEVMDTCFREAAEKGYWFIALNMTWNDVWSRVHLLEDGLEARLERFSEAIEIPLNQAGREILSSYVKTARGDLHGAREDAERGLEQYSALGHEKMTWRCRVQLAEVLTELGRPAEAQAVLPPTSTRTELQDIVYDAPAQIRSRLAGGAVDGAVALAHEILAKAERLGIYRETLAVAAEALVAAGELSDAEALIERGAAHRTGAAQSCLDEMRGRVLIARGDAPGAIPLLARAVEAAEHVGYPLVELRRRVLLAHAVGHGGDLETAARDLGAAVGDADRREARLIRAEAEAAARALGIALPPAVEEETEPGRAAAIVPLGERLVTSLFADVRAYSATSATMTPEQLAERIASMYRSARTTIARQGGIIDKFAGDAVMATFNVSGTRVDHCVQALEAALRLHDRAALTGLPLGIGIAVGPAILGRGASEDNLAVTGVSTNLAARLQAEARAGEVLLSEEAYRRVRPWIAEHGLVAERQELRLKGFDTAQVAYRIPAREPVGGEAVR